MGQTCEAFVTIITHSALMVITSIHAPRGNVVQAKENRRVRISEIVRHFGGAFTAADRSLVEAMDKPTLNMEWA